MHVFNIISAEKSVNEGPIVYTVCWGLAAVYITVWEQGYRREYADCTVVCIANILTRHFLNSVYTRGSESTVRPHSKALKAATFTMTQPYRSAVT